MCISICTPETKELDWTDLCDDTGIIVVHEDNNNDDDERTNRKNPSRIN